ncbi:hypothetical protein J4Q44_G00349120 [Coregonus suidteri]|uniref:Uncharacterized protein n=1 Tax=Coregonus suidteri TaxID=861788 RepID=A0AAN8QLK0_9TELE
MISKGEEEGGRGGEEEGGRGGRGGNGGGGGGGRMEEGTTPMKLSKLVGAASLPHLKCAHLRDHFIGSKVKSPPKRGTRQAKTRWVYRVYEGIEVGVKGI